MQLSGQAPVALATAVSRSFLDIDGFEDALKKTRNFILLAAQQAQRQGSLKGQHLESDCFLKIALLKQLLLRLATSLPWERAFPACVFHQKFPP